MSFLIQINSDTPGLSDLLGGLDKANVSVAKVTQGLKGVDAGTHKTSEGAKELGGAFDKLITNGLDPFLKRAESIAEFEFIREGAEELLRFPGELADKLAELGKEAILAAANSERMGRAFENALGPDVGKETFEYFDAIADKTEFSHKQIRSMGLELAKSGFQGEGLKNAAAAVADLGSMTEDPAAGAERATGALQRIMTTGRVEGRALEPFGIHKGDFEKELSEETGLGMKAMRKAMEAGTIPTETVLNSVFKSITNKTGKDLGTLGTEMSDTLDARLTHLKEKPEMLFETMVGSNGYKQVSEFIGHLGEALDPNTAMGQMLSGALNTAIDELGTTLQGVDLDAVFTEVGTVIKELPDDIKSAGAFVRDDLEPAAQAVWDIFKGILDTINLTIKGLGIAKDAIHDYTPLGAASDALHSSQGRGDKAVDIMAGQGALPSQGGGVGGYLGKNVPGYAFLEDRVFNPQFWKLRFGSATKDAGANDVKGYAGGVADATPLATGAMASMADATTSTLKDMHEQQSPSKLFARIADNDVEGYVNQIALRQSDIEDAMEDAYGTDEPGASAAAGGTGIAQLVFGDISISVTVEGGGDAYETGRLAARGLEDEFELMLLRALEKVNKRQGSS